MSGGESVVPTSGKRVCLLTGAGGRLGNAFCKRYAATYEIVAVYRNSRPWFASQDSWFVDPLEPKAALEANLHPLFVVQADLASPAGCERAVDAALDRFGRIDLLVNAAVHSVWAPMLGTARLLGSFDRQFAMNVGVPLRLACLVAERSWESRPEENRANNRNIVNVSSIAAVHLYPSSGQSLYAASKAALNQLTGHMALEFGAIGVRVNATASNSFPGIVTTEGAADQIHELDQGTATGTVAVLDRWNGVEVTQTLTIGSGQEGHGREH